MDGRAQPDDGIAMMDDTADTRQYMRGFGDWFRHPVEILLLLAAGALFVQVYVPCAQRREARETDAAEIQKRVRTLQARIEHLELRAAALAANDRDSLREAIREELRKGRAGERVIPFLSAQGNSVHPGAPQAGGEQQTGDRVESD